MDINFNRCIIELCTDELDCKTRFDELNDYIRYLGGHVRDNGGLRYGYKYSNFRCIDGNFVPGGMFEVIHDVFDPEARHIQVWFMTKEELDEYIRSREGEFKFSYLNDVRTVYSSDTVPSVFMTINALKSNTGFHWDSATKKYSFSGGYSSEPTVSACAPSPYRSNVQDVIFSGPATIVLWKDGTKTVAKCREEDQYSKEAGLAICYMKKVLGNRRNFNKVINKWIGKTNAEKAEYLGIPSSEVRKAASDASNTLKKLADDVLEALKKGDLNGAGKIITDNKEVIDGDKATL